jgi:hypothetical protein
MILVVVRCGAAGCRKTLATLESFGGPEGGDLIGLLVTADVRREAVIRSDYAGEVQVPMCGRHFQRTDLEKGVTSRRLGIKEPNLPTNAIEWRSTYPLAAELFREPVEKALRTRRTQMLPVR